jgi:hypothetical protein
MDNQEIVQNITSEACVALFRDYALPLQPIAVSADANPELLYCSVIGFSSDRMRGTLVLATTSEPLGRTNPVQGTSLREWVAELSNQLLGRIKRQLVDRGVVIALSTPIVLRGEHLCPLPNGTISQLSFTCDGGFVCVWFDAELAPDLDLSQVQEDGDVIAEGEALLF